MQKPDFTKKSGFLNLAGREGLNIVPVGDIIPPRGPAAETKNACLS